MNLKSQAISTTATLAAVLVLGYAGTARAQPVAPRDLALAQQQNCLSCHSVHRTLMGPALHDIAVKYASHADAQSYLARKITDGSIGVWGSVPMPANTQLSAGQAMALAGWILSLK